MSDASVRKLTAILANCFDYWGTP